MVVKPLETSATLRSRNLQGNFLRPRAPKMYNLRADLFERGTETQFYSDRLAYWIFLIAFCPKTRATTSRRFAIVEVEHPTESLVPADHPNFLYRARHRADRSMIAAQR